MELILNNKYVIAYQGDLIKLASNATGSLFLDTTGGTEYKVFDTKPEMESYILENGLKYLYKNLDWGSDLPIRVLIPTLDAIGKYFEFTKMLKQNPALEFGTAWNNTYFYVYLQRIDPNDRPLLDADPKVIIQNKPE